MKTKFKLVRDDIWLLSRLGSIWEKHFPDISQTNKVFIKFGRYSRFRLGSIKLDRRAGHTIITITSMFKDLTIPTEVVDHTIGHELTHYAQGFSSPHPKLHRYPHEGGVVRSELMARGFSSELKIYQDWMKKYRKKLYAERGY